MTSHSAFFHALLRPPILQILRATGYHSAKPSVVDSLTDIAARYLFALCQATASHATHNQGDAGDYTIVDVRMALQQLGALQPERSAAGKEWLGQEDVRGVEEFIEWFSGERMKELMEMGIGDGETGTTDYLSALMKKHSKGAEESKWNGTVIGRPVDTVGERLIEGGSITSIQEWIKQRSSFPEEPDQANVNGEEGHDRGSPTPSSGLSSVGSRLGDVEDDMDLS
ncbi:hypothetical protein QQS21_010271 [Conoideocrella luteorostrata]|uniref:Bromodomain associated domain-containing protein n=1 Tax=Conoideocrella luteorostrata TaxID=1105319 RepID=A0AAJ0CHP1_9HYPO|nr:hypothetical protein QQS21_010271 [Conoideocrella luteorostrata]